MPTYEYICEDEKCLHEWEEIQKMTDRVETTCPKCLKETAKRLISLSSFTLVGGGWARDNYSK